MYEKHIDRRVESVLRQITIYKFLVIKNHLSKHTCIRALDEVLMRNAVRIWKV